MKAAFIERTGPAEELRYGELPRPVPKAGEVLVKVEAAALNPVDLYVRNGSLPMPLPFPFIPGCDLAGTVVESGPGATRLRPGDRVWGSNQGLVGRQGTFAEFAAVDERWLYPIPDGQPATEAAAGALTGITAHLGLFSVAGLRAGETIFVNGGTGGVGSAVVQLAKGAGARVITTVGSPEKKRLCESWGADLVLDYHDPDLDERIATYCAGTGAQVWFETLREPNFDRTIALMAPRGRIVLMAGQQARPPFPVGPFYFNELRLLGFAMYKASRDEQREAALAINRLYERGGWHPPVARVFPLREAAQAHRLQERATLEKSVSLSGKIVVVPELA